MKPPRSLEQDFSTLEMQQEALGAELKKVPDDDPDVWKKRTEIFHDMIKSARKTQLKKWHPDVCKAPEAVERSAEINAAADGLLTLSIVPPPAPRPVPVMRIFGWQGTWSDTSSTTSNSSTVWHTVWRTSW